VAAGRELPAGTWLDLNVSPRLLAAPGRLREILWAADRALVLEVTEHELIGDYEAVRKAIRSLGRDIRLAVDDAGDGARTGRPKALHWQTPTIVRLRSRPRSDADRLR
jgi:EAL domain-containing protein (putative c-di-GMP-specific phosphodiesterase class I)